MESRFTRRSFLTVVGAGASAASGLFARASQPETFVNFTVPIFSCDCHTHIFGDPARFPFFAGRTYTPETALPGEMALMHAALHIERVVIVTPSVYGTDNSCTLYGMKARGANARGVAVIDENTPAAELERLRAAGFRGFASTWRPPDRPMRLRRGGVFRPRSGRRKAWDGTSRCLPVSQ